MKAPARDSAVSTFRNGTRLQVVFLYSGVEPAAERTGADESLV